MRCPSGSAAHGLSRRGVAKTPICAPSSQANSTRRAVTFSLSLAIRILDSEILENSEQLLAESVRRVVRDRPPGCLEKLIPSGRERLEVGVVLAGPLIDERVELEVDLVEPARQVNGERGAVTATLKSCNKPLRESEIQQS